MTTRSPDSGTRGARAIRQLTAGLSALVTVGIMLAALSSPAVAQTTGSETFHTCWWCRARQRELVSSVVVATGVFNGVGHVVERENLPGDPENVSRDDLVFADGIIHSST